MKKVFTLISSFIIISTMAQIAPTVSVDDTITHTSRWTYGGYAGISGVFGGSGGTSIYISPRGGYKINENFEMGITGNFTWNSSEYHSSTIWGIGPFANYYISRSFYVTGLFQQYFVNQQLKVTDTKVFTYEPSLYIGGGYMQPIGANTYMQIGAMYNVLYNSHRSTFSSGFVPNVGIVVGL